MNTIKVNVLYMRVIIYYADVNVLVRIRGDDILLGELLHGCSSRHNVTSRLELIVGTSRL